MTATSILLVEDEPDVRFTVALGLRLAGLEVRETSSGEEALEVLGQPPTPGCVVLDLRLPGIDGLEVLRRLQADAALREIPVIVLSAHTSRWRADTARELGCHAYLSKPVSQEHLRDVVLEALEER